MTSSLAVWIGFAVLVFWSVGAYNRLVRLRAETNAAFAALDVELQRQVQLVQSGLQAHASEPATPPKVEPPSWAALHSATAQFAASLTSARQRPLDGERIAALRAAHEVLELAWERAEREDAHDLAGPQLPPALTATRAQLVAQATACAQQFGQAVLSYNQAIAQFPALLLAWVFGFKPGRAL